MISTTNPKELFTDYVVVGCGMAGLMVALKLAEFGSVLIISKTSLEESNSFFAQGGIASVRSLLDSFSAHSKDTEIAGAGLCHHEIVKLVVESGPEVIADLLSYGVEFTRDEQTLELGGDFHLTQEGGHSFRRVFHRKDTTGKAIVEALSARVREHPSIRILEHHYIIDVLRSPASAEEPSVCSGALVMERRLQQLVAINAKCTFLCTGGHGRIYKFTSNPPGATGDGLAIAWRAGCRVANLEFIQFHPTCLYHPQAGNFLISEALRGEGGILKNSEGRAFMDELHPQGSLAPRDIVARGIWQEMQASGSPCVFLDMRQLGAAKVVELFPTIYRRCLSFGIDITREPIPVVPAAHYSCGGIVVDEWGQTDIPRLFALGEVAWTGLHGANRLASNSLLEAGVFAKRAALKVARESHEREHALAAIPHNACQPRPPGDHCLLHGWWDEIRTCMWQYVGIIRSNKDLSSAHRQLKTIRRKIAAYEERYAINDSFLEVKNLAEVAWLTVQCARRRKESRGCHYNKDYPRTLPSSYDTILSPQGFFS